MKNYFYLLLFATVLTISCSSNPSHGLEFQNAYVFNGQTFDLTTFYIIEDVISYTPPTTIDSTINLKDKYVIPPYGEAHNHNMDDYKIEEKIQNYLEKGIFYIKNPNSLPRSRDKIKTKINLPGSVDVVFSNGGLTSTDGHPMGLVKRNISRGIFQPEDGEGQFYYTVNDTVELSEKWESIMSKNPDFIKTYLLYSEFFKKRKNDSIYLGWKGLSPEVLNVIVKKAHKNGLRVSVHIETGADFRHAVLAGVDEINHFPGFRTLPEYAHDLSIYEISKEDAKMAREKNITVVTTLGFLINHILSQEDENGSELMALLERNITILKKYDVAIAIGSDNYRGTSYEEFLALARSGFFSNLELLKMWSETTVATIYPNKKLGKLEHGFLANFLVLEENPLENTDNFQKILIRVKEGEIIKTRGASI